MVYIAAATQHQAATWAKEWKLGPKEWRFVRDRASIAGMHDADIRIVSTFWDRDDADDLHKDIVIASM